MKISKTLSILLFCLTCYFSGNAQKKKVVKVSYTTNYVSDFIINILKSKIQDPVKYSQVLNQVSQAKVYHSLYTNLETKESIFVLDSVKEGMGVKTTGHADYTFKNAKNELFGKENFMGKEFNFKGNTKDLTWKITDETKEINSYASRKAVLESNPEIYIWFTTDIPLNGGPYVYFGLPGLVLESNSFFQSTTASTITYDSDDCAMNAKIAEYNEDIKKDSDVSLSEVIIKKENFKRLAEKGKS